MYDIFTYAKNNNLPGMLLLRDFEKAFDSLSFEFILTTLDIFNFGQNFKCWITILLRMEEGKQFNAVTVINGNISTPFNPLVPKPGDKKVPLVPKRHNSTY